MALSFKSTNDALSRTGDKAGPDIVRPPDRVWSRQQVGPVVTDETHTVGAGVVLVKGGGVTS